MKDAVEEELSHENHISIITLINAVIERAHTESASDIHIIPYEQGTRIRLRLDGILRDVYTFPRHLHSEIIARIKVLSRLRTDEHQATQDGRFRYDFCSKAPGSQYVDIRVSIMPTYHGENAVLRLLFDYAENFALDSLGFSQLDRKKILQALTQTSGMILATGPTGSGKTTTLYTLIKILNSPEISIVTLEDPIEYAIAGVQQIQVNPRTSLTFANGLRSILRQDPNVIMVGEIRDKETAQLAINTALTGHLLLSTLHTRDAATTLPRLLDMGIEEYLVSSTISLIIGQRLVRKICTQCTEKILLSENVINNLNLKINTESHRNVLRKTSHLSKGRGCEVCQGSGYKGRIAINEVLLVDNEIREAILAKSSTSQLNKIAIHLGMTSMLEDGIEKVLLGQTTLEEVLRVIQE